MLLHVKSLIRDGHLIGEGERQSRRYHLRPILTRTRVFPIALGLSEDVVWADFFNPALSDIEQAADEICHYGVTEMVNNVIDHADAGELRVRVTLTFASIEIQVIDDGVGIFQKIAAACQLADARLSLIELSKGKFTTDPKRHTGEGVFFTSRVFDKFYIRSSNLFFHHSTRTEDWLVDVKDTTFKGTRLTMGLLLPPRQKLQEVFERFSSGPDDHRFAKTHVPLDLATFGDENLVSRSSAKRVLSRVERFDEVLLDFSGIRSVGQAFADEIFRVFSNEHPKVRLIAINANEQTTGMIRRAQAARKEAEEGPTLFQE